MPVTGEQLILEKEPVANPNDEFAVSGSDKGFSDSWPHSVRNLFTDHVVLYYTKGLCCPLSGVCHITGKRRKGKGLQVPCKYNYYCGPTKDPTFIVIMLLPTKQEQAFIQDQP